MKKNKNQQLMEQREQSQVRLSSAESRQKKAKGQYIQANRDWLAAPPSSLTSNCSPSIKDQRKITAIEQVVLQEKDNQG